jgi:hypothetical protein
MIRLFSCSSDSGENIEVVPGETVKAGVKVRVGSTGWGVYELGKTRGRLLYCRIGGGVKGVT